MQDLHFNLNKEGLPMIYMSLAKNLEGRVRVEEKNLGGKGSKFFWENFSSDL
jgi:hypothetical protein